MSKQLRKGPDTSPDQVGGRLHALRTEQGLTLERLAVMSGLTRGYLSLLERGLKTPSLAALVRIADALQTELNSLFGVREDTEAGYVVYRHVASTGQGAPHTVPLLPGRSGKMMEPFFIAPSFKPVTRVTHSGDELIVVLSGEVLVRLGKDELTLRSNDSLYFTASTDHQLQSVGDTRAQLLVVVNRDRRSNDTDIS